MPRLNQPKLSPHSPAFAQSLAASVAGVCDVESEREQWLLHNYYHPSESLTDADLLQHRRTFSPQRSSLPQQAGRAQSTLHRTHRTR
jgi:hypothetical protein